jgi:hypothetical protein
MPIAKEDIAAELIRRGTDPEVIRAKGYGQIADQALAGMIAPRFTTGDKIADRQNTVGDYKGVREQRDALSAYYPDIANLDRFHSINARQATGGIQHQDWHGLNVVQTINEMVHPQLKEMSGIASVLQGKARPKGSGATSDFEQRLYRQGVPSPEKTGPVNDSIETYMKGVMQEQSDYLDFQENFIRRNGTLSGAQQAWAKYVTKNPYTIVDQRGLSISNPNRPDWKQAFGLAPKPIVQRGGRGGGRAAARPDPLGIRGGR